MKSTILVVDDELSARLTVEAILEGQDYQLEMAIDGQDALKKAEALTPDVILLDLMLPGMDGFEVCQRMRATPTLAEVPILMLTALEDRRSLLRGIEAGADDFLTKPVNRQELIARLHTITRLNRYRTLLEQRESLRQMAERVVVAQEEERLCISRELHDDFGQAITVHKLNLHNLQTLLPADNPELKARLEQLIAETVEMLIKIRRLAQSLRPTRLDTLGLLQAITVECQEFSQRTQILVHLAIEPDLPDLPDLYNVTYYRFLQETLTNVFKHANATQVWVELEEEEDRLSLTVQDNGLGLPSDLAGTDGIGLLGIRERLELIGGELKIRSNPKKGTVLSAYLPLPAAMEKG